MLADNWVLILGIPIILGLLVQVARRASRLRERIAQVREEQARNPLPPFAQLAELIDNQNARERHDGKRTH